MECFRFSTPAIVLMSKPLSASVDTNSLQDSGLSTTTSSSLDEPLDTIKEPPTSIDAMSMQLNEAGPVTLALAG